ncbi:Synerg-CTERM sorting domain-containing protein, partial [Cloacibacillus sp.]
CVITAVTEDGAYSASCEVKVMAATVVHSGGSGGCNGIGAGALALLAMLPCLLRKNKNRR